MNSNNNILSLGKQLKRGTPILVVMPLYNARLYVGKAIESILNQSFRDYLLLIINDGSTDGSEIIAKSYKDDRIKVIDQTNTGPGPVMNIALDYASRENIPFIARMDADDISHPDRLKIQYLLLENYPQMAACSCNAFYIDSETENIIGSSTISNSPKLIRWEIRHGLRGLILGATMFQTQALIKIGGFREQFKYAEEVDVFLRLIDNYELINSLEYLYRIRFIKSSLSLSNFNQNVSYQFFALDCADQRKNNKIERNYEDFLMNPGLIKKIQIWREQKLLTLWRNSFEKKKLTIIILASILDPRRVIIRLIRKVNLELKKIK